MSNIPCISLQVDPYHLKWRQDCTETPKSYDPRNAGPGDILGDFWAIGRVILDNNAPSEVCVDYGHPFINTHPLVGTFWKIAKDGADDDKSDLVAVSQKAKFPPDTLTEAQKAEKIKALDQAFREHITALSERLANLPQEKLPEFFEIHIYCLDRELGEFLIGSIEKNPQKQELLSQLRIRLVLEDSLEFLDQIAQMSPAPAVVAIGRFGTDDELFGNKFFERHFCFCKREGEKEKIYVTESYEKDGNSPSLWCVENDDQLLEAVWLDIDFYYLRWRYMMLWEHCLHSDLHFESLSDAEQFISLGITDSAVVVDEGECDASVKVKDNLQFVWHKVVTALEHTGSKEIVPEITCDGRQPIETTLDNGGARVEFPTSVEDLGHQLTVSLDIPSDNDVDAPPGVFVRHSDGTLSLSNSYRISVSIADDGGAAEIEIICKGLHEKRNGNWVAPYAEDIYLEYAVRAPRNGHWQAAKDPVTFKINGEEVQDSPHLLPGDVGTISAEAKTKSGKAASFTLHRLPRANAIFVNVGHLSSGGGAPCTILREKDASGLCAKGASDSNGRRVKIIRCAQGEEFVIAALGVLNEDRSGEVWDNGSDLQLCDADGNPVTDEKVATISPTGKDGMRHLCLLQAGDFTLRITSRDVPSVAYDIEFSIFADHSKRALAALIGTFILSLATTLCWYGLNIFDFLFYMLCPTVLFYVATHREGCLRKNWHKTVFYLIAAFTVLIIVKALWEELR